MFRTGFGEPVIKTFANKQLRTHWETGRSKTDARLHARILRRLDALDAAMQATDMNLPGFKYRVLEGHAPSRFTVHVNGPWCFTFEFRDGDAHAIDLEKYH